MQSSGNEPNPTLLYYFPNITNHLFFCRIVHVGFYILRVFFFIIEMRSLHSKIVQNRR